MKKSAIIAMIKRGDKYITPDGSTTPDRGITLSFCATARKASKKLHNARGRY
ncbi:hypothetical protein [Anaerophaga thermohalophila]|uniref:hypothetical protein n=1 Tax=Anaerophaga thermohalophila TaxID=177400 RepID=UPI000237B911|nr:hypothetical protein [Anaerophaga thermohalophila]